MISKNRNLSQKHQAKSQHSELTFPSSINIKNRSNILTSESDCSNHLSKMSIQRDQENIVGWQQSNRYNQQRLKLFHKQIRPHERRKFVGKLEPLILKDNNKISTTDTINYLKQMLCLLRSSRQTEQLKSNALKEKNAGLKDRYQPNNQKISVKANSKKLSSIDTASIKMDKENSFNDAQIIQQLINGLNKQPKLTQQKKSALNRRIKRGYKFTLDKLLI